MKSMFHQRNVNSFKTVYAVIMLVLVWAAFAQPEPPQVSAQAVTIDGIDYIRLSWQEVAGAERYNIYASEELDPEDWGDPLASVAGDVLEYNIRADEHRKLFFYVTAYVPEGIVLVEGGSFSPAEGYHVTVSSYYIGTYPVTQAEYEDIMGVNPSHFEDNPNHPVEQVSWYDVIEYCNRLSEREGLEPAYTYADDDRDYGTDPDNWPDGWKEDHNNIVNVFCDWQADGFRLPTEMEWEFAARGGVPAQEADPPSFGTEYSGSDNIDEVAWYRDNSDGTSHPVGTKDPNELGIYDMSGNINEWIWDISDDYPAAEVQDPTGPPRDSGFSPVNRGGSWFNHDWICTVSFRRSTLVFSDNYNLGFRIARSVPPGRMAYVEGGRFDPTDDYNVTLSSFYMGRHQITQSEFEAVMGVNPAHFDDDTDRPVETVSWFDAVEFCNRLSMEEELTPAYSYLDAGTDPDNWPDGWNEDAQNHTNISCDWETDGYRLPTEMEWKFAAKGGVPAQEAETFDTIYSGSNEIDEVAWYGGNAGGTTHPVGTKEPNELGIYDMSGNVYEWNWDIYAAQYPGGQVNDPRGPEEGDRRACRGGSWHPFGPINSCQVTDRRSFTPSTGNNFMGFRLSRSAP